MKIHTYTDPVFGTVYRSADATAEEMEATIKASYAKHAKEQAAWEAEQAKEQAELEYQRLHWNEI